MSKRSKTNSFSGPNPKHQKQSSEDGMDLAPSMDLEYLMAHIEPFFANLTPRLSALTGKIKIINQNFNKF